MEAPPTGTDLASLRAYSERIGRGLAYEKQYGAVDERLTGENEVDWYVMQIAMSGRFQDGLADVEDWTFERSHRAYVAILMQNAREGFGRG